MRFSFELTGSMPLLMHADDVEKADELSAWRKDPKNKSVSVAGDDRSPAWSWQTYLYSDAKAVVMPQECIMAALRFAGAKIAGKGKTTFKALSQSGIVISSDHCKFTQNDQPVMLADLSRFKNEPFSVHARTVRDMGFELLVKRAAVGASKHVRVRPKFDAWKVSGQLETLDAAINGDVINQLFEIAGNLAGLGDWRPSAPKKPGPYGMFKSKIATIN
jgi:hypothetical protein